jgi:quercetin dioxygenase-like cupin family protein
MMLGVAAVKSSDLLKGPPETATMRSGYVVLAPKKSVGKHTTGSNEEALVVLAGSGEMRIAERDTLKLNAWCVAYCPPMAVHDVVNTGQDTLRYVWLVAKAQQ